MRPSSTRAPADPIKVLQLAMRAQEIILARRMSRRMSIAN
jgi:hypothetical protein